MSRYKSPAWCNIEIKLNEIESDIYALFSDFIRNVEDEKSIPFLLDIASKFMQQHLHVITDDNLSNEARESKKIHVERLSNNI